MKPKIMYAESIEDLQIALELVMEETGPDVHWNGFDDGSVYIQTEDANYEIRGAVSVMWHLGGRSLEKM